MKLLPNWQAVLARAWSVRFMLLAGIFTALEVALPLMEGVLPVPPLTFSLLAGGCTGAAFVSRLVAQNNLPER